MNELDIELDIEAKEKVDWFYLYICCDPRRTYVHPIYF
jgi:hypothetical protein